MVKAINTSIANVAVSTSWGSDHIAFWAETIGLELLKQLDEVQLGVFLNVPRVHAPGNGAEDHCYDEQAVVQVHEVRVFVVERGEDESQQQSCEHAHYHEEKDHCPGVTRLLLEGRADHQTVIHKVCFLILADYRNDYQVPLNLGFHWLRRRPEVL